MKSTTRLLVLAFIASFGFYSCTKDPVLVPAVVPTVVPKPAIVEPPVVPPPPLARFAKDFKMILPKGNQIVADGVDELYYKFIFYGEDGNPMEFNDYTKFFNVVKVNGVDKDFKQAIKTSTLGNYDISITINGITKSYPVIATTADKKIVEIPIIFNFVSTDYSDKVVDLTFTNLVNTYKRAGVDNVVFKLAEFDNEGRPLKRKGVKFWDFKGTATDKMSFIRNWSNMSAFNVYLIDNLSVPGASAYTNGQYIVIDNAISKWNKEHVESGHNTDKLGLFVLLHEMGHVLGLKHIFRDDNICQVQEGVNDIQAINDKTTKVVYNRSTQVFEYTTNCGKVQNGGNLIDSAGAKSVWDFWLSKDQVQIAKKTALTLKF
jgi:hypothetical protein